MRVLFDHQAFSIQPRGGISRYVMELARRLATRPGVVPCISAGLHRSLLLKETPAPWITGRYTRGWPRPLSLRLILNAALTRRQLRRWQPDIVHETYFRTGAAYAPGVPTVLTLYDLTYFVFPDADDLAARTRRAQQAAIARARRIICISENTRRDLLRLLPVNPERVVVIPLAGPAPENPDAAPPPRPDIDGPYILHVGLRNSYKNFDVVLQAFAASPALKTRFRLVVFGGGALTMADTARMRSLGLDPARVAYRTGDDTILARYYAHARAYVTASLYEGFGLPALEAMTAGCPVVCSNAGSLPEITADAALLFCPTAPSELTQALETLVRSATLAEALRARGHQQAARFSWDRCADETLAVYENLLR